MGYISTEFCLFSIFLKPLLTLNQLTLFLPLRIFSKKAMSDFCSAVIFLCALMFILDDFAIYDLKVAFRLAL